MLHKTRMTVPCRSFQASGGHVLFGWSTDLAGRTGERDLAARNESSPIPSRKPRTRPGAGIIPAPAFADLATRCRYTSLTRYSDLASHSGEISTPQPGASVTVAWPSSMA